MVHTMLCTYKTPHTWRSAGLREFIKGVMWQNAQLEMQFITWTSKKGVLSSLFTSFFMYLLVYLLLKCTIQPKS